MGKFKTLYEAKKFKVDMNIVKKHDSSPAYLRLVKKEIKAGNGFVEIAKDSGDRVEVFAADTHNNLLGTITIPKKALKESLNKIEEQRVFDSIPKDNTPLFVSKSSFIDATIKNISKDWKKLKSKISKNISNNPIDKKQFPDKELEKLRKKQVDVSAMIDNFKV